MGLGLDITAGLVIVYEGLVGNKRQQITEGWGDRAPEFIGLQL